MKLSDARMLLRSMGLSMDSTEQLRAYVEQNAMGENIYQEMEMDSTFVDTYQDISHTTDPPEQHSHVFYEILYCEQGQIGYLMGTKHYDFRAGDVIFLPPGVIHSPIFPEKMEEPYRRCVVWVSPAFAKNITETFSLELMEMKEPVLLQTAGTKWNYLGQFFRRGVEEAERQAAGWEACVCGNTLQLLTHLERALNDAPDQRPLESQELLEQILDYIQQNLHQKITLSSAARHFRVSESTISQLFRKRMGMGFYRCVTQRRLAEAKSFIGQGSSLEQVSEQVGFRDYSCFYRAFKGEYGISPAQYRKLLQTAHDA